MNVKEVELLIQLVKVNPAIYDRSHALHNNQTYIKDSWCGIANELNQPVKKIRDKWKNLRDSYRTQLYKLHDVHEPNDGSSPSIESNWPYYQQMHFLEEHMQVRKSVHSRTLNNIKRENDHDYFNDSDNRYPEIIPSIEMVTVDDFDPSVLENLNYHVEENAVKKRRLVPFKLELEEDKYFFDSLLPYMKRLTPKQKMLCRMKIQEVIFSIAFANGSNQEKTSVQC